MNVMHLAPLSALLRTRASSLILLRNDELVPIALVLILIISVRFATLFCARIFACFWIDDGWLVGRLESFADFFAFVTMNFAAIAS